MYRDLGFIRVWGGPEGARDGYGYLIYPHKPIVAFLGGSESLLSEYCVEFATLDEGRGSRLPESDDVLAKWMALNGDEERLIKDANMHLPGRQVDPQRVRRDLARLAEWERNRERRRHRPTQPQPPDEGSGRPNGRVPQRSSKRVNP